MRAPWLSENPSNETRRFPRICLLRWTVSTCLCWERQKIQHSALTLQQPKPPPASQDSAVELRPHKKQTRDIAELLLRGCKSHHKHTSNHLPSSICGHIVKLMVFKINGDKNMGEVEGEAVM